MDLTPRLVNLILQTALMLVVFGAGIIVKRNRKLKTHCLVMRIALALLVISTLVVMIPSFISLGGAGLSLASWFFVEMYLHAAVGIALLAVFVYVNLAFARIIKRKKRLIGPMRTLLALWVIVFAIGVHMYFIVTP